MDSSNLVTPNDVDFDILGQNLVRADHPANTKSGGVCIYFKKVLPLRILNIYFLQEYVIRIWNNSLK